MESSKKILFTALFFLFFNACNAEPVKQKCPLYIISEGGAGVTVNAEIADTPELREKGLMYRKSLNESDGMLFVFEKEIFLNFWMKNTLIPLDIAYIDKNGIINEIYTMKPLDVSIIYNSIKPAMYALEVNSGWFSRHKIKTGSKIEFNGCISKQNSLIER
ncbi:MAG: hypothetical protein CVV49_06395 [Spirochaetae bacterium HGW-Spirochaetae-5]|nr:MAG: hypothetical protein CVV49_06395 [Spirochaetae bacterium HGW-Spirochaetae-5]